VPDRAGLSFLPAGARHGARRTRCSCRALKRASREADA